MSGVATQERNKNWSSNEKLWHDALAKAPNSGRTKLNLAQSYIEQDRHPEAIKLCKEAEKHTGATTNKMIPVSLHLQGIIAYKEGQFDTAVTYFKEALSLRSDYTDVNNKLIVLFIELERYEEALSMVLARYQETAESELLLMQASLLLRLNKPEEALRPYHEARIFFRIFPRADS